MIRRQDHQAVKGIKRVIGWIAVACGVVLAFMGASPIFEAIHWEGVFLGLGAFVAGAWVLVGPEVRQSFRHLVGIWVQDRRSRQARGQREVKRETPAAVDPLLPVRILRLAQEHHGVLTLAQVAIELNVPIPSAEAGLAECVRAGNAVADYDIPHSYALYRFPEFASPQVDTEDTRQ